MTDLSSILTETRIIYKVAKEFRREHPNDQIMDGFLTLIVFGLYRTCETVLTFMVLLLLAREKLCAEPVDRVYGLLGLMDRRARQALPVDYSAENRGNPWPLFTKLGKFVLDTDGFELFELLSSREVPEGAPSWLPNLLGPAENLALTFGGAGIPRDGYESLYYQPAIATYLERDEIDVRGLRLDRVDSVVELQWRWSYFDGTAGGHKESGAKFLAIEGQCLELLRRVDSEFKQEKVAEIMPIGYCRALVGNAIWLESVTG
jgi:hypothetical protein